MKRGDIICGGDGEGKFEIAQNYPLRVACLITGIPNKYYSFTFFGIFIPYQIISRAAKRPHASVTNIPGLEDVKPITVPIVFKITSGTAKTILNQRLMDGSITKDNHTMMHMTKKIMAPAAFTSVLVSPEEERN